MTRKKIKKIRDSEKIAAGEVVERPANIVKEIIENSIDAGAREIRVIVKNAGKDSIQIIDDGIGIPTDEIEFAFESHTSSKIRSIEDLDNLSTLGFRGEALASITTVSQVEIISRTEKDDLGVCLNFKGGKLEERKEISCPIGTNIKVKNLFYNIPARQKFLKSNSTELGHITDFIQRYSLAYPDIHFIYRHNDLDILNCPCSDLITTVFHLYGKLSAKFMEPVNYAETDNYFRIYGLIGHPQISKKRRNYSSLFINHRYVISDLLYRAVQEAYKGILMTGKYPFFVLHLEMDPSKIDFNIHPKKLHVRFEDEEFLYNKFFNVIKTVVEEKFIVKEAKYISTELGDFASEKEKVLIQGKKKTSKKIERPIKEIRDNRKEKEKVAKLVNENGELIEDSVQLHLSDHDNKLISEKAQLTDTYIREKYIIAKDFPKLRLISSTGQLSNKIYIVLDGINEETNESGLYLLDQHAASERVNKEKLLRAYKTSKIRKQMLISPLKIDVSPNEKFFLEENVNEIKKLGFNFEHFGGNTFILRDIPTIMERIPDINVIKEIISDITEIGKDKSFSETKNDIINYLSCHKSVRGGDDLSLKDIRNLIVDLSKCKDSYHCAHGRPTLKFISFEELDKLFKRKV